MERQSALAQPEKGVVPVKLLPDGDLFDRVRELSNTIARRAFEFFEHRGRAGGHDLEDWFRAEAELLHPVHVDLAESDDSFTVRAEVPGFTAKELKVGVEPHGLSISGKRESSEEHTGKKTIYSERRSNQIYRAVDLPAEVDTSKVTATLKDGMLELSLPKAKARTVQVKAKTA